MSKNDSEFFARRVLNRKRRRFPGGRVSGILLTSADEDIIFAEYAILQT